MVTTASALPLLDDMEPILKDLEEVRSFPHRLLEYLRDDEHMQLAAQICESGQIKINVGHGTIESIEFRQWARVKKRGT